MIGLISIPKWTIHPVALGAATEIPGALTTERREEVCLVAGKYLQRVTGLGIRVHATRNPLILGVEGSVTGAIDLSVARCWVATERSHIPMHLLRDTEVGEPILWTGCDRSTLNGVVVEWTYATQRLAATPCGICAARAGLQ